MSKHTLGPWAVNDSTENDDDTTLTICAPADEVEIATMSAYENGCECFSEIRANAHLIAAAPAMYEALVKAMVLIDIAALEEENRAYRGEQQPITSEARDRQHLAQAALAQAEGRG